MAEIQLGMEQLRLDLEANGKNLADTLKKRSEECEICLKDENKKLNRIYKEINNYQASRDKTRDVFLKFEEEMEKFKESREKENALVVAMRENINEANEYIRMRKQGHEYMRILTKIINS
ncbi:uncharacterized protein LOC108957358 [Eucalyptus grandis]|uniref:uncharacterized protein LOC108957358 n=1 Tax=Eucalyptus grandis TaxID=71139 RepID=UPI00192EB520|nr:uncharacterized protein LOC108957358 [Eucalyptus grandis]